MVSNTSHCCAVWLDDGRFLNLHIEPIELAYSENSADTHFFPRIPHPNASSPVPSTSDAQDLQPVSRAFAVPGLQLKDSH